jgi:predicted alpha/beta-hydrolase family hydrolase
VEAWFASAVGARAGGARALVLGGFSRGARIAAAAVPAFQARALLCFGYPFHVHGRPQEQPGLRTLRAVRVPTLIIQGTRDAHGSESEVRGYGALPTGVRMHWLQDGNHRFVPPARSTWTRKELLRSAADASLRFLRAAAGSPDA